MSRIQEINSAIEKLKAFRADPDYGDRQYAIDENIIFLEAIKSLPRYAKWLITRAKKIDGKRLLELTDFPVEEWDVSMHKRLIQIERNKHIGLGKPLVDGIFNHIKQQKGPLKLVNLGAGGMEVDRQVIEKLIGDRYNVPIIFIGVDKSPITNKIAYENLKTLGALVKIVQMEQLTKERLDEIAKNNLGITVILCKNDIFKLDKEFPAQTFDVIYHSLFKHHIKMEMQKNLDAIMEKIAKKRLEYDGFRTWPVVIPQSIAAWKYPIFLGGTIFSVLRYETVDEISRLPGKKTFYKKTGHCLREF